MEIQKLYPVCKDYLWGGNKLNEKYGKSGACNPCAESWELSFHTDGKTRVANGQTLEETITDKQKGSNVCDFSFFPVMTKLIDAKQNLSIQVHPADEYALSYENSYGKTEMWYIVEAEEGAGIYLGFNRDITPEEYKSAILNNTLTDLLNFYPVKKGDCFFIPAGTIHAIGAGCLICEIQQNSNTTYRVYDYGRVDKNGKSRELHIDKALGVTNLNKHVLNQLSGSTLGVSKYFNVQKVTVDGVLHQKTNNKSFHSITCLEGEGKIDGNVINQGDSFFVPADYGEYVIAGRLTAIVVDIRKYYLGIDLGGTYIKGGIVDDTGNIIYQNKVPTQRKHGAKQVVNNIVALCNSMLDATNLTTLDITGVGIGVPGTIDSKTGKVTYSNNLGWSDFSIATEVSQALNLDVKIANDANVAALGEAKFGSAKDYQNSVMLTLGTGVGSGIVLDGKLFEGHQGAGAEIGHMVVVKDGEKCSCGRQGCLEAYASASALVRDTKRAMQQNPKSKMFETYSIDAVSGRTAFEYYNIDKTAKEVVDKYIKMLGLGITNVANIFRPEVIILGGGICNEGDALTLPLQNILDREVFGGNDKTNTKIITATLGNDAGLIGAAALWL